MSPVGPRTQAARHVPDPQMPLMHADIAQDVPSEAPAVLGITQRRQTRTPPLQYAPYPQTRPPEHMEDAEHSSASGEYASHRIVVWLQMLLPEHAYVLQHGCPATPQGGRPPSTGIVSVGGATSVGGGTSGSSTSLGCVTSGVLMSAGGASVLASVGAVARQVATPLVTVQVSLALHAGLHAETHAPATQV